MVHYPVMDHKDIAKLSVASITDKDCILFLWATFPNLREAIYVMKEWGFTYKTLGFIWIKTNKDEPGWTQDEFFIFQFKFKLNVEHLKHIVDHDDAGRKMVFRPTVRGPGGRRRDVRL